MGEVTYGLPSVKVGDLIAVDGFRFDPVTQKHERMFRNAKKVLRVTEKRAYTAQTSGYALTDGKPFGAVGGVARPLADADRAIIAERDAENARELAEREAKQARPTWQAARDIVNAFGSSDPDAVEQTYTAEELAQIVAIIRKN